MQLADYADRIPSEMDDNGMWRTHVPEGIDLKRRDLIFEVTFDQRYERNCLRDLLTERIEVCPWLDVSEWYPFLGGFPGRKRGLRVRPEALIPVTVKTPDNVLYFTVEKTAAQAERLASDPWLAIYFPRQYELARCIAQPPAEPWHRWVKPRSEWVEPPRFALYARYLSVGDAQAP